MPDEEKMNGGNISCSSMQPLKIKSCKNEKCSNEELMNAPFNSDSDSGSTSSLKSPEHSPRAPSGTLAGGGLTLEQFTDIVLAQERLEKVEDESNIRRKDITIQERQSYTGSQTGAKLKPVVLTPRHMTNLVNPIPNKSKIEKPAIHDDNMRDQMRKQLESVIRKNEEILEKSHVYNAPLRRGKDVSKSNESPVNKPLNLSVRKDLMKPKNESENVSGAIEKLLARHGRDLEITRKSKRDKMSVIVESPPEVNMTRHSKNISSPKIFQPTPTTKTLEPKTLEPEQFQVKPGVKRASSDNNNFINVKKIRKLSDSPTSIQDKSVENPKENQEKIQTIIGDLRIALQVDVNGNYPLHNAVLMSNLKLVKRFSTVLSALGQSLDLTNKYGETPLHLAVTNNQPRLVSELILSGASPSVATFSGESCYHLAVKYQHTQCLSQLLNYTRNPLVLNTFNDLGQTCLQHAAASGDHTAARMLLSAGANPDMQNAKSGKTALYLAVEGGHHVLAEMLQSYGASLSLSTYAGSTPASLCSDSRKIGGAD